MTAVSGHVRSEWTCEQEVQKKHSRWPLLYHLKSYTRAIRELYHLKSSKKPLTIALLITWGHSDWNSTLTLAPWLHLVPCTLYLDCTLYLVPCTLIASQFSIPYLHLRTLTCTLWFPFTHFYMHTFGHSFTFSLFCNLFLLAFPLKLTFHLDCSDIEVSHLHSSAFLLDEVYPLQKSHPTPWIGIPLSCYQLVHPQAWHPSVNAIKVKPM